MIGKDLAQQIRIGCSGWQYKHWRADFYPADLPQSRWFAHYARHFDTVEINNSFYRLPLPGTFVKWREQAPRRFLYAVKASRFLTHMKKLKDPEDALTRFFDNATMLGPTWADAEHPVASERGVRRCSGAGCAAVCASSRRGRRGAGASDPRSVGTRFPDRQICPTAPT